MGSDGTLHIMDIAAPAVWAVDRRGTILWRHETGQLPAGDFLDPNIGLVGVGADGRAYVGSMEWALTCCSVVAVDPDLGVVWRYELGRLENQGFFGGSLPAVPAAPLVGPDGTVYVSTGNAYLLALEP